ncbi:MAG: radical SAM protein [Oscillospiraceae bacterium]|nr:radical SAM protein [Oscillospiraceae bacterium]
MHTIQVKSILSPQNGMNLYRGCQHGCIYCDSRSKCYQMDHTFEDVAVKENALELLEQALRRKRQKCMIGMGAMTDPYIPLELELGHTRGALELIAKYGFGATLITKSNRVLRDLDLFQTIHRNAKCVIQMTLTTYDDKLCQLIEPNVCPTSQRFQTLETLRDAGIPTVVWLTPILPFLNDTEANLMGILEYCRAAGVQGVICFDMGLTLREGNREYFYAQLDRKFPGLKAQYQRRYGNQYQISSPRSKQLMQLFHNTCESYGILHRPEEIFHYLQTFPEKSAQMSLFDL